MKKTMKQKHEELVAEVKNYIHRHQSTRTVEALILPAYGKAGEANDPNKQPNVVFVKDLISQVKAAETLGFQTRLTSDGKTLSVFFVEGKPSIPLALHYAE